MRIAADMDDCELCHGASGGVRGNENVNEMGLLCCDYCSVRQRDGSWLVLRHGGRSTDTWRIVFRGAESKARARYERLYISFRQGVIELVSPTAIEAKSSAPRLRTRW